MDQTQEKAREIDLIAEKIWPFNDPPWGPAGDIAVRLFIECKYVPSNAVFWFADKDKKAAKELVCSGGLFRDNNIYTEKHHYISQSPRVAKLFTSSGTKAPENEPFYKALNQALNGMVSLRGKAISIPEARKSPKAILEFPVVVCSSFTSIYFANFENDEDPKPISANFQLEVRYAYIDRFKNQCDDYFLLDVVEFGQLEKLMEAIAEDVKNAGYL